MADSIKSCQEELEMDGLTIQLYAFYYSREDKVSITLIIPDIGIGSPGAILVKGPLKKIPLVTIRKQVGLHLLQKVLSDAWPAIVQKLKEREGDQNEA